MTLQRMQNANYRFTCSLHFMKLYLNIIKPSAFFLLPSLSTTSLTLSWHSLLVEMKHQVHEKLLLAKFVVSY